MSRNVLEKHVEGRVTRWAKQNGWLTYKWSSGVGGVAGVPDRLFIPPNCEGRVLAIEFKRPGNRPTVRQNLMLDKLARQGMVVCWSDNADEAIDWLRENAHA